MNRKEVLSALRQMLTGDRVWTTIEIEAVLSEASRLIEEKPNPNPTQMYSFWVVWSPRGGPPTVRHASKRRAKDEAKRLAGLHPNADFFVLKAQVGYRYQPEHIKCFLHSVPADSPENDEEDIPF